MKRDFDERDNDVYIRHINSLKDHLDIYDLNACSNVAPILDIREVQKDSKDITKGGVVLVRQYFNYNLKERIQSMPYLKQIEKMWITFQMIYSVYQLHSKSFCHGDIKTENFCLTTAMTVFLTDAAPYKPAYIPQDELGLISYYFGEVINDRSVCLAPERLIKKKENISLNEKVTTAMDVFSLGCVIAELFSEKILFDLQGLLDYKESKVPFEVFLPFKKLFTSDNIGKY